MSKEEEMEELETPVKENIKSEGKKKKKFKKPTWERKKKDKGEMKSKENKAPIGANLIKPEKKELKTENPELREVFTPLLLIFVATAWILLIFDLIVVLAETIGLIVDFGDVWNGVTPTGSLIFVSDARKAFLVFNLIWYLFGSLLGIVVFYMIADWKIRLAGKNMEWGFIFKRITKKNLPALMVYGFILMIMNVGYVWSAILMFISATLVYVMYPDEKEFVLEKESTWEKLTIWMKGFTILGMALLIWSVALRFIAWLGSIFDYSTDGTDEFAKTHVNGVDMSTVGWDGELPLRLQFYGWLEITYLIIMALVIWYYWIPYYYSHMVNSDYKKITESTFNIGKYKCPTVIIPLVLTFLFAREGQQFGFEDANWGFLLIASSFLILYIFAPFDIWWMEPKAKEAWDKKWAERRARKANGENLTAKDYFLKMKGFVATGVQDIKDKSKERKENKEKEPKPKKEKKPKVKKEKKPKVKKDKKKKKEDEVEFAFDDSIPEKEELKEEKKEKNAEELEDDAGEDEIIPEKELEVKSEPEIEIKDEETKEEVEDISAEEESDSDLDEGEEELDQPESEDYVVFPQIQDEFMKLFDDGNFYGTKGDLTKAIEDNITLPEGLNSEEAIEIAKEKELIHYSRSAPRGYHKTE